MGGNLGDPAATFAAALRALQALGRVDAASHVWRTAPVGGPTDQPMYLNAVVRWRPAPTWGHPSAALAALLAVEAGLGRRRRVPWGPRTIDLDLLDGRDWAPAPRGRRGPVPELPHPRAAARAFVVVPWAEVAPGWPLVGPGVATAAASADVAARAAALGRGGVSPAAPSDAARWAAAAAALGLAVGVPADDA